MPINGVCDIELLPLAGAHEHGFILDQDQPYRQHHTKLQGGSKGQVIEHGMKGL